MARRRGDRGRQRATQHPPRRNRNKAADGQPSHLAGDTGDRTLGNGQYAGRRHRGGHFMVHDNSAGRD